MKKSIAAFIGFTILLSTPLLAQRNNNCITLKPGAEEGKDVVLTSYDPQFNLGDAVSNTVYTWTAGGNVVIKRFIIQFNLDSIPENALIDSAKLSLFYNPTDPFESFATHSGGNEMLIRRVLTPWDEFTATWVNQPMATAENQVLVPRSTSDTQDYIDIDITNLIADIHDAPEGNNGLLFLLENEQQVYRALLFSSSDHLNPALHPAVTICWTMPTSTKEPNPAFEEEDLALYPNPSSNGVFSFMTPKNHIPTPDWSIEVFDALGRALSNYSFTGPQIVLPEKGVYTIVLKEPQGIIHRLKAMVVE